LRYIIHTF
jgi:hypothetical protein